MKLQAMALAMGVSLCVTGPAFAVEFCEIKTVSAQSPFQEIFQPTCHNCYEIGVAHQMGADTFQEVLSAVKNVEIDFWDTQDGLFGGVPKEWFVRHDLGTVFESGNDNNCTGNGEGTNNLGACLTDIKDWSDDHPGHPPITLFLDKKQAWSSVNEKRRPADLDDLVTSILGSKLYKPASLQKDFPTLRQAAKGRAWPSLGELAGKVIIVLTGGQLGNHNATLSEYVEDRRTQAALFVAADTDEESDITGTPNQFNSETAGFVVFYNIEDTDGRSSLGKITRANDYVARLWNGDGRDPCSILANCINDNGLKRWNQGACSGQSEGTLHLLNPDGWLPQQKESSSNFLCSPGTVMSGRWHDCKNKGDKCDENGNSTVFCRNIEHDGILFGTSGGVWSGPIKESSGVLFLCPSNTVMTGRQHQGDENGETKYFCSQLSFEGHTVPVNQNDGAWSEAIVESTSQFVCPDNQILNGRTHQGDENGLTKYHCMPIPSP